MLTDPTRFKIHLRHLGRGSGQTGSEADDRTCDPRIKNWTFRQLPRFPPKPKVMPGPR